MLPIKKEKRQGWGWPLNAKKAHYFIIEKGDSMGISLCGRWGFFGGSLFDEHHNRPQNCKKCMKKRVA